PAAWTDAAHKNGTDIMSGMKFFDTTGGGTGYASGWMKFITEKDADGNFVYAEPMINLLMYFGFDGINYNWEDSGYGNDDIVAFHKQLYKIAARKGFYNFHCGIYTSVSQLNAASPENTNALFGN
ncbi:endo-beta-N-acetylglucosaminidase, partial [Bacillus pumilus]